MTATQALARRVVAIFLALLVFGSQTAAALPLVFCAHEDGTFWVEWQHTAPTAEKYGTGSSAQLADLHPVDCEDAPVAVHPVRVQSTRLDAPKSVPVAAPAVPQAVLALQLLSPPVAIRHHRDAAPQKSHSHLVWIRTVKLTV